MNVSFLNIYRKIKTRNDFIFIIISFFIVLLLIFVVPEFFPNNYYALTNYDNINSAPTLKHIFGTDYLGRDVFIRVLMASKLSLQIACITSIVSVLIGTIYGVISGYFGGKIDTIMMRIVDGLYAIPFIFLSILLVAIFGRNFLLIFIAIGCVSWLDIARVIRGQTLEIKNKEYILAAKIMGLSSTRIIFKHVLHNLISSIVIFTTLTVPSILYTSTFLGFMGFGVQPPLAGLGELISDGSANISIGYWWTLLFPCIFMIILVLLLNGISGIIKEIINDKS